MEPQVVSLFESNPSLAREADEIMGGAEAGRVGTSFNYEISIACGPLSGTEWLSSPLLPSALRAMCPQLSHVSQLLTWCLTNPLICGAAAVHFCGVGPGIVAVGGEPKARGIVAACWVPNPSNREKRGPGLSPLGNDLLQAVLEVLQQVALEGCCAYDLFQDGLFRSGGLLSEKSERASSAALVLLVASRLLPLVTGHALRVQCWQTLLRIFLIPAQPWPPAATFAATRLTRAIGCELENVPVVGASLASAYALGFRMPLIMEDVIGAWTKPVVSLASYYIMQENLEGDCAGSRSARRESETAGAAVQNIPRTAAEILLHFQVHLFPQHVFESSVVELYSGSLDPAAITIKRLTKEGYCGQPLQRLLVTLCTCAKDALLNVLKPLKPKEGLKLEGEGSNARQLHEEGDATAASISLLTAASTCQPRPTKAMLKYYMTVLGGEGWEQEDHRIRDIMLQAVADETSADREKMKSTLVEVASLDPAFAAYCSASHA
jgi:hypothetical protein